MKETEEEMLKKSHKRQTGHRWRRQLWWLEQTEERFHLPLPLLHTCKEELSRSVGEGKSWKMES